MTRARRVQTTPRAAARDDGYPVAVAVPMPDGPLILTDVRAGTRHQYTVSAGVASAGSRDALTELRRIGGQPIDTPPAGAGSEPPDGGTSA